MLVIDVSMFTAKKIPALLPWKDLGVDVVMECTGFFVTQESAGKHIEAGAKYVVISAPASDKETKTVVYNVNHNILTKDDHVISAASCTTNCLAPMMNALNQKIWSCSWIYDNSSCFHK